jgi:hypothetical protein
MTTANDLAIRRALELAGVEFIDENGGGPGGPAPQASAAVQIGRTGNRIRSRQGLFFRP